MPHRIRQAMKGKLKEDYGGLTSVDLQNSVWAGRKGKS